MLRKLTYVILMCAGTWSVAFDLKDPGKQNLIEFETDTIDLGVVSPGKTYEGAFKYSCLSSKPVNAQLILVTCRCMVLEESDLYLKFGMTGMIPAHQEGYLFFNFIAPETGKVNSHINIMFFTDTAEQQIRLYVNATVREVLKVPEGGLSFDLEESPDVIKTRHDLTSEGGNENKMTEFLVSPPLLKVERVGPLSLDISLCDETYENAGQTMTVDLKIRYSFEEKELERIVPIVVRVPNPCIVTPNPVLFGRITQPHHLVATTRLNYEGEFGLGEIIRAPDWSEVRFGKIPGEKAYVVYIMLKKAPPKNSFAEYVLIETNRKKRPVKIPFFGNFVEWPE